MGEEGGGGTTVQVFQGGRRFSKGVKGGKGKLFNYTNLLFIYRCIGIN